MKFLEAVQKLALIKEFLCENLGLELNSKTQIFKSKQGVNFCGYKINEYRLKIRDKGKRKFKKRIKYLKYEIRNGKMTSKEAHKYLVWHLGYIKIANVKNLKDKLFCSDIDIILIFMNYIYRDKLKPRPTRIQIILA